MKNPLFLGFLSRIRIVTSTSLHLLFESSRRLSIHLLATLSAFALMDQQALAQSKQTFTASGTWTCPPGVTSITVECWGGGGGGGAATGSPAAGGGGAGGAYVMRTAYTVVPGTVYTLNIGAGGARGSSSNGGAGGSTWFGSATTILAVGGAGGLLASSNNSAALGGIAANTGNIGGTISYYGGDGAAGTSGGAGGGGGGASAGSNADGTNASGITGGAAVLNGGAGASGSTSSASGQSAQAVGGGGAGGRAGSSADRRGGRGFAGKIVITIPSVWTNPIDATSPNLLNPYTTGDVVSNGITVSGISRGTGIIGVTATGRYNASGWNSTTLNANDYYQFTITPSAGYSLNLTTFAYTGQLSSGTASYSFRSSLDNYATSIGTASTGNVAISLSATAYQFLTTPITFRLYVWNASSSNTTFSVNDFTFIGTIISASTITSFNPASLCASTGQNVVITGSNFSAVSSVKFNGVNATYVINSPTQITAALPATAASGNISVTTPTGTFFSSGVFEVLPRPVATYTASPAASICTNLEVTYTTQIDQTIYTWSVPGTEGVDYLLTSGVIDAGDNSISLKWLTGGNKTVGVSYTDAFGCSSGTPITTLSAVHGSTPQIVCPTTQVLALNGACNLVLPDFRSMAEVTDACASSGALNITQFPAPSTVISGLSNTTVNLTVTNLSNQTATCMVSVQAYDDIAPVVICPATQQLPLNQNGVALIPNYQSLMSATDECNGPSEIIFNQIPPQGTSVTGIATTLITMYAQDASGNMNYCEFNVNTIDNTPPVITCPAAQNVILNSSGGAVMPNYLNLITVTDNVSSTSAITLAQSPAPGSSLNTAGDITVTISATDAQGNASQCQFITHCFPQTTIQMSAATAEVNEGSGSYSVTVNITNPSSSASTAALLVLSAGDAAKVNGFSNQVINFPAGSNTSLQFNVTITDNSICDITGDVVFSIQNVSGGNSAIAGAINELHLNIIDNESLNPTILTDNLEDGDMSDWRQSATGVWAASSNNSLNGTYSIKHTGNGGAGQSWLSYDLNKLPITGVITEWKFNLSHFGHDPDPTDNFMIYLASSEADPQTTGSTGYAIGVSPGSMTDPDIIKLWKMSNGVPVQELISTAYDLNATDFTQGWLIRRTDVGEWQVYLDVNGGFDNLQLKGSATDRSITRADYFSLYYRNSSNTIGQLAIDDISIVQSACVCTYYSQSNGSTTDVLWSTQQAGSPFAAELSRYKNVVIQQGHSVSIGENIFVKNLQVNANATLSVGANEVTAYGNLTLNGTFNSNQSTVSFRGGQDHTITGNSSVTFNNLKVDDNGFQVILNPTNETYLKGVAWIPNGTLVTNNKLTLQSSVSGTASIGTIGDQAALIGKITMQRYIPVLTNYPNGGYLGLGCPVQGCTIADWNDDIITTGFTGADYPPPYSFNNISWYNETVAGGFNNGYVYATNVTNPLYSDRGYFVFMQTGSQLPVVKGDIYHHDFNKTLSYTNTGNASGDGWNLLVNQYPSEVDFKLMANNGNGVSSYSVFDAESNNYKTYNAYTNAGNASRYIPSSQSFFVKAGAAGAFLKYREIYKTQQGIPFERDEEALPDSEPSQITFRIASENGSSDEAILGFHEFATPAYDFLFDSPKLSSPIPEAVECALISDDEQQLSLDTRMELGDNVHIPVYLKMPTAGSYTFSVMSLQNINSIGCISIEDIVTGEVIPLQEGQSLTLMTNEPFDGIRLLIRVRTMTMVNKVDATCHDLADGKIVLEQVDNASNITLMDDEQHVIYQGEAVSSLEGLRAGNYHVIVHLTDTHCSSEIHEVYVEEPLPASVILNSFMPDECGDFSNAQLSVEIQNMTNYHYEFVNSHGESVYQGEAHEAELFASELEGDVYEIEISDQCGGHSIVADLRDPDAVEAVILSDDIFVTVVQGTEQKIYLDHDSKNYDKVEWKLSNGVKSDEEVFEYAFTDQGKFELKLKADNSFCDDQDEINIHVEKVLYTQGQGFAPVSMVLSSDYIMFTLNQDLKDAVHLSIHDSGGQLIWSFKTPMQQGKQIETSISQLAAGVYIVSGTVLGQEVLNKKIIH